jgi:flagellin-like protein
MKNFRRSKKALSPVVASIILIAVTVAVSIAVAAWMGALTIGFMGTEEVRITNVEFLSDTQAQVTAKNTGSIDVTLTEAYVGNNAATASNLTVITPGQEIDVVVDGTYVSGTSYQFKLVSSKGNPFVYTATAPTS